METDMADRVFYGTAPVDVRVERRMDGTVRLRIIQRPTGPEVVCDLSVEDAADLAHELTRDGPD